MIADVVSTVDGSIVTTITVNDNRVTLETPEWILVPGDTMKYDDYVAKAAHSGYYWVREAA